jgi:Uncharacterized alpha/beta hydrolase domain (DUF2235)
MALSPLVRKPPDGGVVRKIILLSDGTGNSSAKIWRTNVWRLFEALDLSSSEQVAFYDDGIGTSSFKPWAIIAGAFGFGLKRNVVDLYKFACRNYRSKADQIFGFGFSRGAFTIRVVIGLILDQGLIDAGPIDESELNRLADRAYRTYRRKHFHTNWGLIYRAIQGHLPLSRQKADDVRVGTIHAPCIRFLGLWDTVAAYGLPVDEMTRGFSQWIWPLEIPSHTLRPEVKRACHALALDDERTTFHPVLWNERDQHSNARYTKDERISQVWFAGMHANVGGGYPDDSLAKISLYWIMEEARACGLTLKQPPGADPNAIAQTKSAADKDGRLYNSRAGFASYYRYGPRKLSQLGNQRFSRSRGDEVYIARPKIHESVLKRIDNNAYLYAPLGLPCEYDVVTNAVVDHHVLFEILPPTQNPYETPRDAKARSNFQERLLWSLVSCRALLYYLTILVSVAFFIFPISGRPDPMAELSNPFRWVSDVIRLFGTILPGFAQRWINGYAQNPRAFLLFAATLLLLMLLSTRIADRIANRMSETWKRSLQHTLVDPGPPSDWVYKFRERWLWPVIDGWKFGLAPFLSAIAIVYVAVTFSSHALFNIQDDAGLTCRPSETLRDVAKKGVLIHFPTSELCHATKLIVRNPDKYLIWVNPDTTRLSAQYSGYETMPTACEPESSPALQNGRVKTTPVGYSTLHNNRGTQLSWQETLVHSLLTPLRRELDRPWFQLVARYGSVGGEETFLDPDPNPEITVISDVITPTVSGELFLFVNDAVIGIPGLYRTFYHDNKGCIAVFIQPR